MEKKAVSGIMLTLLSISILSLAFNIQPVKASGTIYIRADGSVDPPYAPIQRSGNVYNFTGNIGDPIAILRDNIVVDGAGYTVDIKTEGGISLGGSNITFKNTRITSSAYYTPTISAGSGNTVSGNTITYAAYGISLSGSGSTVSGNTITYAKYDGILLGGSSGSTVSDNTITAGEEGIHLNGADHNDAFGNVIRNSGDGIFLRGGSDYNMFSGNEIANNRVSGICLSGSSNNTISGNVITNSNYGIELYYTSNNNAIFGNAIRNNERGVYMSFYQGSPTNNAIYLNNITNNEYGVYLESSDYNKFYHNNFVGNTKQVYLYDSIDYWDDDYPSGGNYWSDYTGVDLKSGPNQDLSGSDGIGDTQYVIEGYIKDRYPLMNPWTPTKPLIIEQPQLFVNESWLYAYTRYLGANKEEYSWKKVVADIEEWEGQSLYKITDEFLKNGETFATFTTWRTTEWIDIRSFRKYENKTMEMTFDPGYKNYEFPLYIGKEWTNLVNVSWTTT